MVALMLVTVLSAGLSANAIIIQKESSVDEETFDTYVLQVNAIDENYWPSLLGGIVFAMVVVTSEDNPFFKRVGLTGVLGGCYFSIPDKYEYPTVKAYYPRYERLHVYWWSKNEIDILMRYTGKSRTVNNPFLKRFLILQKLIYSCGWEYCVV